MDETILRNAWAGSEQDACGFVEQVCRARRTRSRALQILEPKGAGPVECVLFSSIEGKNPLAAVPIMAPTDAGTDAEKAAVPGNHAQSNTATMAGTADHDGPAKEADDIKVRTHEKKKKSSTNWWVCMQT